MSMITTDRKTNWAQSDERQHKEQVFYFPNNPKNSKQNET